MWTHHIWTDPKSRRLVRAWKPFNGLRVYDPEAWEDDIEDESVFDIPPAICKEPSDPTLPIWRIHCDDDGNYDGTPPPPEGVDGLICCFLVYFVFVLLNLRTWFISADRFCCR